MYAVKRFLVILISFIVLTSSAFVLSAQENIPTLQLVRNLNNDLLRLHSLSRETQQADPSQVGSRCGAEESGGLFNA